MTIKDILNKIKNFTKKECKECRKRKKQETVIDKWLKEKCKTYEPHNWNYSLPSYLYKNLIFQ